MNKDTKIEIVHLIKDECVKIDEEFINKLIELSVPETGPADTVLGEMLRAYQYIKYRYVNDGDMFNKEGVCETNENVTNSWNYIKDICKRCIRAINSRCTIDDAELNKVYLETNGRPSAKYYGSLILDCIIDFAQHHPGVFKKNTSNGRDGSLYNDGPYEFDYIPVYEKYDQYVSYIK